MGDVLVAGKRSDTGYTGSLRFSWRFGFYCDMPPLDTELQGPVDLVLPHRDVDAVCKPPVHAVENDTLAVLFDFQDRIRINEVRGADLEPPRDEAAEILPRGPDARLIVCLFLHSHVVGGYFPDDPRGQVFDGFGMVVDGHNLRSRPQSRRSRHVDTRNLFMMAAGIGTILI